MYSDNNDCSTISIFERDQQHPDLLFLSTSLVFKTVPSVFFLPCPGLLCTFDFISLESVVKAFSTLIASFADVYKYLIPNESAKVFPSSVFTCLLAYRSNLLPIKSFTTF